MSIKDTRSALPYGWEFSTMKHYRVR